jgi:hypothetical protein
VKRLLVLIALALSVPAYAQVKCQTGTYNPYAGSTTTCNGSFATPPATLPVQPVQNYGAMLSSAAQAQAAQTTANAQMLQAQVQARLAQQQAELMRQQTEALQRQQVQVAQPAPAAKPSAQEIDNLHASVAAAVAADTTVGLKAKVATLEAVQRNSPPDSETFRNATGALLIINTELAKRGELKP